MSEEGEGDEDEDDESFGKLGAPKTTLKLEFGSASNSQNCGMMVIPSDRSISKSSCSIFSIK